MSEKNLFYTYSCDEDEIDVLGLKLTVTEAAFYSGISIRSFIRDAKDGFLLFDGHVPSELPASSDTAEWERIADSLRIFLSELPPFAIRKYLLEKIVQGEIFRADFTAYKHRYGKRKYEDLINDLLIIKSIYELWNYTGDKNREDRLDELLDKYAVSRSAYYRYLAKFKHSNLAPLIEERNYHARTFCLLAEDLIKDCVFNEINLTYEEIFEILLITERSLGEVCHRCPHNCNSNEFAECKNYLKENYPDYLLGECRQKKKRMRIPANKEAIARYIRNMDESMKEYARVLYVDKNLKWIRRLNLEDVIYKETFCGSKRKRKGNANSLSKKVSNHWNANYGDKVIRQKPEKINEVVFADHSQLNVWLFAGYDRGHNPVIMRPWVTCLMDFASGAIIGSVVSFSVTKRNIAECICRAAAVTIDSPFYGLPKVLYCDRGKDFMSKQLLGDKKRAKIREGEKIYPNRAIFSDGLLALLNVEIRHAKAHSPWTKPIEGAFHIINRKYMRRVPGFCGTKKRGFYTDILEGEKRRLLKNAQLWDIEQFSYYWFHHIIPSFNNRKTNGKLSPSEKYHMYPRANTLTPSWSCMAALLQERKTVKVHDQGIYYHSNLYSDQILTKYINKKVIVYDFFSYATDCIYVLYSDEEKGLDIFLGEIPLKERVETIEKHRVRLARNLAIRNMQKNYAEQTVEAVHYLNEYMKMCRMPYDKYDMVTREITHTMYAEKADEKADPVDLAGEEISLAAMELNLAMLKEKSRILKEKIEEDEVKELLSNGDIILTLGK